MIIVDKAEKTTINIPKNSLGNTRFNDYATQQWVKTNYYNKEEVDELIANSEIPYFVVGKNGSNYEYVAGDFNKVKDAVRNNKPYLIYLPVPTPPNDYLIQCNAVQYSNGWLNCIAFFHYYNNTHYYLKFDCYADEIRYYQNIVTYATLQDLANKSVESIFIDLYGSDSYETTGNLSNFISAINNNKPIAVFVKKDDIVYNGININLVDGVVTFTTSDDDNVYKYTLGEDEDFGDILITNLVTTPKLQYATEQWVDDNYQVKGDYLTSIPDEYVTETELTAKNYATQTWVENNYATNSDVNDEIGKLDSSLTSKINKKQDTLVSGENIKTINGNSLLGSGDIIIEGGGSSNIVELTQAEYDALGDNVDADTLYLISDATISANYKTINGESILGEGNIEISGGGTTDLSNYYTKTESDNKFQEKGDYLTSVPDEYVTDTELTNKGYVTQQWIEEQGYLTSIPSEYVTESELDIKLDEIDTKAPYIIVDYENEIWEGDFQGVIDAMKNGEEYFIYATIDTHIYLATQNVVGTDRLSIYWFRVSSNRTQRVGIVFDYNGNFISKTTTYANVPVDNLTSTSTGLPLSANQGKVLKGLIDSNSTEITNLTNTIGDINNILETIIG